MFTPTDMISIKYEGGRASGTAASCYPNVTHAWLGNRGEEEYYARTKRRDAKGRVIFTRASVVPSIVTLLKERQHVEVSGL